MLAEAADGEAGDVLEELWGAAAAAAFNQRRAVMGYRVFGLAERLDLIRCLYVRACQAGERPSVLFDLAANRLVEAKVLLPGVTVLEQLVASVRDRAAARALRLLAAAPSEPSSDMDMNSTVFAIDALPSIADCATRPVRAGPDRPTGQRGLIAADRREWRRPWDMSSLQ